MIAVICTLAHNYVDRTAKSVAAAAADIDKTLFVFYLFFYLLLLEESCLLMCDAFSSFAAKMSLVASSDTVSNNCACWRSLHSFSMFCDRTCTYLEKKNVRNDFVRRTNAVVFC